MTAKTGKDEAAEVEAVPAEEQAETEEAAARPARPARRKRRVRVIEVIDDEDLDEVLEALDAEDEADAEPAEPAAKPAAKPAVKAAAAKAAKPRPTRLEPPEEEAAEEEPADEAPKKTPKKTPARASAAAAEPRPGAFGLGLVPTVVIVVLVALLASLAIWKWTSASSLSSERDDREAIGEVASEYGDLAFSYNASNYQTQSAKAQKLMAGDLLEDYTKNTLPSLASAFQSDAQVVLSSKTNQVFVGTVNGRFATAVVMADVSLKTKDGAVNQPATLLRLSLSKVGGEWKVTQQYPSGVNDENKSQLQNSLPGVPGGGASKSPKAGESGKPKN
ncbi:hypothetical protein [Actinomadura formosensis]|uniref:hypothetical protein n=1 Tax=Actinomadura formosensis TaxID=60706 RepID=UPI0008316EEF|nr:hypothetical protein [Actinomadura formosensis]